MPQVRIDPELEARIVQLYVRERRPRREVAALCHVGEWTVGDVVRRNGHRMRGPGGPNNRRLPHAAYEIVRRLYEDELMSEQEIAEQLGISRGAVQYRLNQTGVKRRNQREAQRAAHRRRAALSGAGARVAAPTKELATV